jgi:hypothetical protein
MVGNCVRRGAQESLESKFILPLEFLLAPLTLPCHCDKRTVRFRQRLMDDTVLVSSIEHHGFFQEHHAFVQRLMDDTVLVSSIEHHGFFQEHHALVQRLMDDTVLVSPIEHHGFFQEHHAFVQRSV